MKIFRKIIIPALLLCFLILIFYHVRICLFYNLFHIPCVGCGLTRAFESIIFKQDIVSSFKYNVLALPLLVIAIIYLIWTIKDYIKKDNTLKIFLDKYKIIIIGISFLITIIVWIINLCNPLLY